MSNSWLILDVNLLNYNIKDVKGVYVKFSFLTILFFFPQSSWLDMLCCKTRNWISTMDSTPGFSPVCGSQEEDCFSKSLFVCFWTGFNGTMCVFTSASWLWLVTAERTLYQTFCPHWALARLCVVLNPCLAHSRGDSMWQQAVFLLQTHTSSTHFPMVREERCLSQRVCAGLLLLFILNQMPVVAKHSVIQWGCACVRANLGASWLIWADAADKDLCQCKEQQMMCDCVRYSFWSSSSCFWLF